MHSIRSTAASCLMGKRGNLATKKGFHSNIEKDTLGNKDYRRVIYTGVSSQLVLMSIPPGEEIGLEVHNNNDQFLRFEGGEGLVRINDNKYKVSDGFAVVIPSGAQHNVVNTSMTEPLKLYSLYSPPHHQDKTVHITKMDETEEEFDGVTTE